MADVQTILRRLLEAHPEPKLALRYRNPLELLVAAILSAQCTDARVNEVTRELFRHYHTARDFAEADREALEQAIHSTGFFHNKAKNLMACGRALVDRFGGEVPESLEALMTLPGVGRKTANMVRGNLFGQPAVAVDTHVLRVSQRLGLCHTKDAEAAERELASRIPAERLTQASNALILHGREICTARRPRCEACSLCDLCHWEAKGACA